MFLCLANIAPLSLRCDSKFGVQAGQTLLRQTTGADVAQGMIEKTSTAWGLCLRARKTAALAHSAS